MAEVAQARSLFFLDFCEEFSSSLSVLGLYDGFFCVCVLFFHVNIPSSLSVLGLYDGFFCVCVWVCLFCLLALWFMSCKPWQIILYLFILWMLLSLLHIHDSVILSTFCFPVSLVFNSFTHPYCVPFFRALLQPHLSHCYVLSLANL